MEGSDSCPQICTPGAIGMELSFNKEKKKKKVEV